MGGNQKLPGENLVSRQEDWLQVTVQSSNKTQTFNFRGEGKLFNYFTTKVPFSLFTN